MKRRKFLLGVGVSAVTLSTAGYAWTKFSSASQSLTIDSAIDLLDSLNFKKATSTTDWDLAQVFIHCAQSVECSMKGFPEHKSALFQETVGSLAFSLFKANGSMTHNTSEEIPGLMSAENPMALEQAIKLLKTQLIAFQNYQGPLQPHFAYGELSKRDYEIAHVLHLHDHYSDIDFQD